MPPSHTQRILQSMQGIKFEYKPFWTLMVREEKMIHALKRHADSKVSSAE